MGDKNPRETRTFSEKKRQRLREIRGKVEDPALKSGKKSPQATRAASRAANRQAGIKASVDTDADLKALHKEAKAGKTSVPKKRKT